MTTKENELSHSRSVALTAGGATRTSRAEAWKVNFETHTPILGLPFILVLIYIFLEYGRPYSLIPIGVIRPAFWVSLLLGVFYLRAPGKNLKDPTIFTIIVFILIMAKSIPTAFNQHWAFKVTLGMAIYLISILLPITVFVVGNKRLRLFLIAWVCIHILTALLAIRHGGKGIGGILADENDFALAINMVLPYAYFMYIETRSSLKKTFYILAMLIYVVACMYTMSRGGFLGLLTVGAFILLCTPHKMRNIAVLVLFGLSVTLFAPANYKSEIASIFHSDTLERDERQGRIYLWKIGFKIFLDRPIMGVGPGSYKYAVGSYEDRSDTHRLHSGKQAHSVYFTLLPELGFPGALVFGYLIYHLLSLFIFVRRLDRQKTHLFTKTLFTKDEIVTLNQRIRFCNNAVHAVAGSAIGFLSSGIFLSVLYYPHIWITLVLSVAVKRTLINDLEEANVFSRVPGYNWKLLHN